MTLDPNDLCLLCGQVATRHEDGCLALASDAAALDKQKKQPTPMTVTKEQLNTLPRFDLEYISRAGGYVGGEEMVEQPAVSAELSELGGEWVRFNDVVALLEKQSDHKDK